MKNNQIEEMKNNARIYIGATVEKLRMDGCELWEIDGIVESILNYITVPEDSIVLTKEEYETWFKKDGYYLGYRDGENSAANYYENLALPSTKIETAEKFINLPDSDILIVDTQEYGEIEVVSVERLQEIAKSLGVDTKE